MTSFSRDTVQLIVVLVIFSVWAICLITTIVTGNSMALKIITPLMTMTFGWLFAAHVTGEPSA